jgi:hypothetical protein
VNFICCVVLHKVNILSCRLLLSREVGVLIAVDSEVNNFRSERNKSLYLLQFYIHMRLVLLYSLLGKSSAYSVISTNKILDMKKSLVSLYWDKFNLLCIPTIFQNSIKVFL